MMSATLAQSSVLTKTTDQKTGFIIFLKTGIHLSRHLNMVLLFLYTMYW